MRPVVWLDSALQDLQAITEFIAESNPVAAQNLVDRLVEDADSLGTLPVQYRRGRVAGTHELVSLEQKLLHRTAPTHRSIKSVAN